MSDSVPNIILESVTIGGVPYNVGPDVEYGVAMIEWSEIESATSALAGFTGKRKAAYAEFSMVYDNSFTMDVIASFYGSNAANVILKFGDGGSFTLVNARFAGTINTAVNTGLVKVRFVSKKGITVLGS